MIEEYAESKHVCPCTLATKTCLLTNYKTTLKSVVADAELALLAGHERASGVHMTMGESVQLLVG